MSQLFFKLVNMSIAAGWLIIAVIILRFVLKKVPKSIICIMWAIAALRLILPFSIQSAVSLIPDREFLTESLVTEAQITVNPEPDTLDITVDTAPDKTETTAERLTSAAAFVWLGGMAVMVTYAAVSFWKIHRRVSASVKLHDNVYICDEIDTPFILGVIKPRIYLNSAITDEQQAYVTAHENAHLQRRDHWWKPLGFALLTVYWFNPLVWAAYILLCRDIELACDEKVIKQLGEDEKKSYSGALLSCSVPRRMVTACPLAFGEVGVKERIKSVLSYKKPAFWVIIAAAVVCAVVAVCFLTDPLKLPGDDDTSFLNYRNAVSVIGQKYSEYLVWCTTQENGNDRLQIGAARDDRLITMLENAKWYECREPAYLPTSESVEFVISQDENYRISVHKKPHIVQVSYGDESRFYRCRAKDYDRAVEVIYRYEEQDVSSAAALKMTDASGTVKYLTSEIRSFDSFSSLYCVRPRINSAVNGFISSILIQRMQLRVGMSSRYFLARTDFLSTVKTSPPSPALIIRLSLTGQRASLIISELKPITVSPTSAEPTALKPSSTAEHTLTWIALFPR